MSSNKEKMIELRDLFENGLITEEEYESRKKELLDSFLADKDESQTKGEHIENSKTRSTGGNKLIIAIIAVLCIAALLLLGTKLFKGNNSQNSSLDSKDTIEKNLLLGSYEQSEIIVSFAKDGTFYVQRGQSTKERGDYYVNEENGELTLVDYKQPTYTCKYKYFLSDDTLVLEDDEIDTWHIAGALKRNGEAPETAFDINPDPAIIIGNHFLDEDGWHYYFGEDGYYFEEKNSALNYFGYEGSYEIDGNKINVKKVDITSSYGEPEERTHEFEFFDGHVILYISGRSDGKYLQNWDPAENDSSIYYDSETVRSWSTYFSDMLYEEDPNAGFSGEYEEDPNAGFSGETENSVVLSQYAEKLKDENQMYIISLDNHDWKINVRSTPDTRKGAADPYDNVVYEYGDGDEVFVEYIYDDVWAVVNYGEDYGFIAMYSGADINNTPILLPMGSMNVYE